MSCLLEGIFYYFAGTINTFSTAFLLQCIIIIINSKKYSIKKLLLSWLMLIPIFLISTFIQTFVPHIIWIKPILCTLFMLISTTFIYKLNLLKSLLSIFLVLIISLIADAIVSITILLLKLDIDKLLICKYKFAMVICLISIFQIFIGTAMKYLFFDKQHIKTTVLDTNAKYIIPQFLSVVICLLFSMAILVFNNYKYALHFIFINVIQLAVVSYIGIYNLNKSIKHKEAEQELENTKLFNKSLMVINEQVKGIKHDMGNIVQAISGYLILKDYEGATKYCNNILKDFCTVNLLSVLSPNIIDEPSIYGIIARKKYIAEEKGVELKLSVTASCKDICFPLVELTRCIGILLDNALEATLLTEEKKFWVDIRYDFKVKSHIILVGNSVADPDKVDTVRMFEHGYSTKKIPSGIGLYEIIKFMNKHNTGHIHPEINREDKTFTQEMTFEINNNYILHDNN